MLLWSVRSVSFSNMTGWSKSQMSSKTFGIREHWQCKTTCRWDGFDSKGTQQSLFPFSTSSYTALSSTLLWVPGNWLQPIGPSTTTSSRNMTNWWPARGRRGKICWRRSVKESESLLRCHLNCDISPYWSVALPHNCIADYVVVLYNLLFFLQVLCISLSSPLWIECWQMDK